MNATTLKNLHDTEGLPAVNAAIETLGDHAQIVLLEELEAWGFAVKWHFNGDERDSGAVVAVPDHL